MSHCSRRSTGWIAILVIALVLPVRADFHDGGVARCNGCHVVHESADGMSVVAGDDLLLGETASDTCLLCHGAGPESVLGSSVFLPGVERGGGDFVFLLEDQLNDGVDGLTTRIAGEAAGHSVVAPASGLVAESRWASAPGGAYPVHDLGCTSCHDPHGNASFRMLHGAGPVQEGRFVFSFPAPEAEGIDAGSESPSAHTAYRSGWSAWCANCHGFDVHGSDTRFPHPVDTPLGVEVAKRYADYGGDQEPGGGTPSASYLPQVPYEDGSATTAATGAPGGSSRLNCMSCHRAHATSAPAAGRWDFRVRTLGQDGVISGSYALPNPYLAAGQRSLCVKCHDTGGHDAGRPCLTCHDGQMAKPDPDPLPDITD